MSITEEEVDAFLEHRGVKGMHWGIRNKRTGEPATSRQTKAKEARKGALKAGLKAAIPAAVVSAGVAFALYKMRGYGKAKKVADIARRNRSEFERSAYMLDQLKDVKIRAIKKAASKGTIIPEHANRLTDLRIKKYVSDFSKARQTLESYKTYSPKLGR